MRISNNLLLLLYKSICNNSQINRQYTIIVGISNTKKTYKLASDFEYTHSIKWIEIMYIYTIGFIYMNLNN